MSRSVNKAASCSFTREKESQDRKTSSESPGLADSDNQENFENETAIDKEYSPPKFMENHPKKSRGENKMDKKVKQMRMKLPTTASV